MDWKKKKKKKWFSQASLISKNFSLAAFLPLLLHVFSAVIAFRIHHIPDLTPPRAYIGSRCPASCEIVPSQKPLSPRRKNRICLLGNCLWEWGNDGAARLGWRGGQGGHVKQATTPVACHFNPWDRYLFLLRLIPREHLWSDFFFFLFLSLFFFFAPSSARAGVKLADL